MSKGCFLIAAALVVGILGAWAPARAIECEVPPGTLHERPDPDGPPTEVSIGLYMSDIQRIDDLTQTVTVDFYATVRWTDPRLSGLSGCQLDYDAVWNPRVRLLNSGRLWFVGADRVAIHEGGLVEYTQRFQGTLASADDVRRFPFDERTIRLSAMSLTYAERDVRFVVDESSTGRSDERFTVPAWDVGKARAHVVTHHIPLLQDDHARFEYEIPANRRAGYYLGKILLPLVVIVLMSWSVFWVDPAQVGPQLGLSATSMLTLIAFQFSLARTLPPVSYFTLMDRFITGSFILVFLALAEAVATSYLTSQGQAERALRMDRAARWVFPSAFVVLVAWVLLF